MGRFREPRRGWTRRHFLRRAGAAGLAVGALPLAGCGEGTPLSPSPGGNPFQHGVASGDPLPDHAVDYQPPFDRCDREADMRQAYAAFAARLGRDA